MNALIIPMVLGIIIISIFLYFTLRPSTAQQTFAIGPYKLSSKSVAIASTAFSSIDTSTAFLKDGQGTFQCFVYLDQLSKTGEHVDCGQDMNQPSCETGLYNACTCTTPNDCTNCVHSGYKHLVSLYGVYTLEIMNVPDASRPNSVAVQLAIRTNTENTKEEKVSQIETIPLPPLSQQKWTMITISREGRRIDVYYNNEMVSSSKTTNMICVSNVNGSPVMIGDSGLSGQIGVLSFFLNRFSIQDVSTAYARNTDTRGSPLQIATDKDTFTQSFSPGADTFSILHRLCLDGSCLTLPRVGQPDISTGSNIFTTNEPPQVLATNA